MKACDNACPRRIEGAISFRSHEKASAFKKYLKNHSLDSSMGSGHCSWKGVIDALVFESEMALCKEFQGPPEIFIGRSI